MLYLIEVNQNKNNEKEKSKIIIKIKRENINKKKYENNFYNGEKNEQSKDVLFTDIIKKEKFLVNKYSKLQKALEKNNGSKINKNRLEKNKNCVSNVECYGTDDKIKKISEKYKYNLEKNEISKSAETSTNKIEFNMKREKFCNNIKDGKNSNEKINMNKHIKEYKSQENENKYNYKRKNNKLNINEKYENKPNEYYEDIKNNKKLNENKINKLYRNDNIENENILENIKIKRKERKYKFNIIYIIILNIIFFSRFIKCYNRKI